MAKRLNEHLTSRYFEAANMMTSKSSRRRIVAYVESYDDVFFWRTVLGQYENDTRYFEVMLPTKKGKLERGKKAVLMAMLGEQVGQDMIACVDADYDYLIQGMTPMSETILNSPYIFHCYAYSIENMQCYAPSLHDICVSVTLNDHALFDFETFFRHYSEAIFPLFVWNIWYYRTPHYGEFTITDFNKVIEMGRFNLYNADVMLDNLRSKVGRKVKQLQKENPNAKDSYQEVKNSIKALGVTPQSTYLYIQGHHLFDTLVIPMLTKVCDSLIRKREGEIHEQAMHNTQLRNELSNYNHSIGNIETMLKRSRGYIQAEPFKKIQADIERYLNG